MLLARIFLFDTVIFYRRYLLSFMQITALISTGNYTFEIIFQIIYLRLLRAYYLKMSTYHVL